MKELISSKLNDLRHTGSKLIAVHLNKYCVITKKTPKEKNTTACIWNLWRNVIIERLLLVSLHDTKGRKNLQYDLINMLVLKNLK